MTAFLILFQHHISYNLKHHSPPVDHIPWAEVEIVHVALDLTGREDIVPHVDVGHHPNKGLSSIKPTTLRVLLL